ncbi:MAG: M48 family metallopeptidase [Negativicutes bacterium]|nr:M48 family metallopeptidase [Negativicutes bacterium]
MNYSEDELMVVVAHEMSHGLHDDARASINKQLVLSGLLIEVLGEHTNAGSVIMALVTYNYIVQRGFTLPHEVRADEDSFRYIASIGGNVRAPAALWARVADKLGERPSGGILGEILNPNNHPSTT